MIPNNHKTDAYERFKRRNLFILRATVIQRRSLDAHKLPTSLPGSSTGPEMCMRI